MKLFYKPNTKLEFELEGSGQKEVFKELATIQEIFGEEQCGVCKKANIKYVVRTVDDNDYYELRCNDCGAVLSFGQHKKEELCFQRGRTKKTIGYQTTVGTNGKKTQTMLQKTESKLFCRMAI